MYLPPNYQTQLIAEVVELRGNVADLQEEGRGVRESATRDAHRGRREAIARDQKESRIKVWHLIATSVLSSVVTASLTWVLTKWLGE